MMDELVKDYTDKVNADKELKAYRDWIEANAFGFGERCFLWMWNEIVKKMPDEFTFMEIGVFRGQILAIVSLLAERHGKKVRRIGITPLDTSDGHWESDYEADIIRLHDVFNIKDDYELIRLDSTNPNAVNLASNNPPDVLYIDGGHTYEVVKSDLTHYLPILKVGGTLVIDDCNNAIPMPWGYFQGIQSVSLAVDEVLPREGSTEYWKHELNLVHNRVLTKLK
jgi:cephalosporin hydroxylase